MVSALLLPRAARPRLAQPGGGDGDAGASCASGCDRGVDGFRIDAIDRLVKDAELRDDPPASAPFALPLREEYARLEHLYSTNSPDIRQALAACATAAGDALLVGEVYLPAAADGALPRAPRRRLRLRAVPLSVGGRARCGRRSRRARRWSAPDGEPGAAWVLSNHDFPRLPDRFGRENVRAAAVLMLTLPGPCFVYQGDEIGQRNGPEASDSHDRAGRDPFRHPVQWEPEPLRAGFTTGEPWLAPVDARRAQRVGAARRPRVAALPVPRADRPAAAARGAAGDARRRGGRGGLRARETTWSWSTRRSRDRSVDAAGEPSCWRASRALSERSASRSRRRPYCTRLEPTVTKLRRLG